MAVTVLEGPGPRRLDLIAVLEVTAAALPCLGIVARMLPADQRHLLIAGFGLWVLGIASFFFLHRLAKDKIRWGFLGSFFVFTFTFVPRCTVCVLVAGHFLRKS
jgi:hypothetical protein